MHGGAWTQAAASLICMSSNIMCLQGSVCGFLSKSLPSYCMAWDSTGNYLITICPPKGKDKPLEPWWKQLIRCWTISLDLLNDHCMHCVLSFFKYHKVVFKSLFRSKLGLGRDDIIIKWWTYMVSGKRITESSPVSLTCWHSLCLMDDHTTV